MPDIINAFFNGRLFVPTQNVVIMRNLVSILLMSARNGREPLHHRLIVVVIETN